jgi:hypothetical protein
MVFARCCRSAPPSRPVPFIAALETDKAAIVNCPVSGREGVLLHDASRTVLDATRPGTVLVHRCILSGTVLVPLQHVRGDRARAPSRRVTSLGPCSCAVAMSLGPCSCAVTTSDESGTVLVRRRDESGTVLVRRRDESGTVLVRRRDESETLLVHRRDESGTVLVRRRDESGTLLVHRRDESGTLLVHRRDESATVLVRRRDESGTVLVRRRDESGTVLVQRCDSRDAHDAAARPATRRGAIVWHDKIFRWL